jgi:hypothetical protein
MRSENYIINRIKRLELLKEVILNELLQNITDEHYDYEKAFRKVLVYHSKITELREILN